MAAALHHRGVTEPQASLAAEAGLTVFRVAMERWTSAEDDCDLADVMRQSMAELRAVAGGG